MRQFTDKRLLVATHNAGKLDEMRALLAPYGVEVVGAAQMGLAEPAETEDSFVGNARIKARAAMQATGLPVCRTTAASASMPWAARRVSRPRTGPKRPRAAISPWPWSAHGANWRRWTPLPRVARSSAARWC